MRKIKEKLLKEESSSKLTVDELSKIGIVFLEKAKKLHLPESKRDHLNLSVELLNKACELTNWKNLELINYLSISYIEKARFELQEGKIEEAKKLTRKAIGILRKASKITNYKDSVILNNLGIAYEILITTLLQNREVSHAKLVIEEALEEFKNTASKEPEIIETLGILYLRLGEIKYCKGKYQKAKEYLNKAILNFKRLPKTFETYLDLGNTYIALAEVSLSNREINEAENFVKLALAYLKQVQDYACHDNFSYVLNSLISAYSTLIEIKYRKGEFEEVDILINDILNLLKGTVSLADIKDPILLGNICDFYANQSLVKGKLGKLKDAKKLLRDLIEILHMDDKSSINVETGKIYAILANFELLTGNIKDAERLLGEAVRIFKKSYVNKGYISETTEFLINYAAACIGLSDILVQNSFKNEARNLLEEAVETLELAVNMNDCEDFDVLKNLAILKLRLAEELKSQPEELEKAKGLLNEALQLFHTIPKKYFADFNELGNIYQTLAEIEFQKGRINNAKKLAYTAASILEKACDYTKYKDPITLNSLGNAYELLLRISEESPLLEEKLKRLFNGFINCWKDIYVNYSFYSNISYYNLTAKKALNLSLLVLEKDYSSEMPELAINTIFTIKSPFMKTLKLLKVNSLSYLWKNPTHSERIEKSYSSDVQTSSDITQIGFLKFSYKLSRIESKLKDLESELERSNINLVRNFPNYLKIVEDYLNYNEILLLLILDESFNEIVSLLIDVNRSGKEIDYIVYRYPLPESIHELLSDFTSETLLYEAKFFYYIQKFNYIFGDFLQILHNNILRNYDNLSHIYIIPFGALNLIPFHALSEGILLQNYSCSYLPDLGLLKDRKTVTSEENIIFAYDENQNEIFYREAERIREILDIFKRESTYFMDPTRKTVINNLEKKEFEIVYFSTHGKGGRTNAIASHLILKDGELTVLDLMKLNFRTDVAILSACEVNLTLSRGLDDSSELERAFLSAGARNVVAAYTPVKANQTLEFIPLFVEKFLERKKKKNSKSVAEAYRKASLEMIKKGIPVWIQFRLTGVG